MVDFRATRPENLDRASVEPLRGQVLPKDYSVPLDQRGCLDRNFLDAISNLCSCRPVCPVYRWEHSGATCLSGTPDNTDMSRGGFL